MCQSIDASIDDSIDDSTDDSIDDSINGDSCTLLFVLEDPSTIDASAGLEGVCFFPLEGQFILIFTFTGFV